MPLQHVSPGHPLAAPAGLLPQVSPRPPTQKLTLYRQKSRRTGSYAQCSHSPCLRKPRELAVEESFPPPIRQLNQPVSWRERSNAVYMHKDWLRMQRSAHQKIEISHLFDYFVTAPLFLIELRVHPPGNFRKMNQNLVPDGKHPVLYLGCNGEKAGLAPAISRHL